MKAEYTYQAGPATKTVVITATAGGFQVSVDGQSYQISEVEAHPNTLSFIMDGQRRTAQVAQDQNQAWVKVDGQHWRLSRLNKTQSRQRKNQGDFHDASGQIVATMPARVGQVLVAEGDTVERGQPLILLEAMKMEVRLVAPFSGIVQVVRCEVDQTVERHQPLVLLVKP